ncbi:hypothetical protein O3G_MSEX013610 [Manduca sexta]|uniref:Uncharacterized protein n=1 Tax=Manduca sexta TaxID=7130 RepID=A0A921ZT93_MANSE|nr:hypothetical protein O3G_MSEX013610 [Manduca sexta]
MEKNQQIPSCASQPDQHSLNRDAPCGGILTLHPFFHLPLGHSNRESAQH